MRIGVLFPQTEIGADVGAVRAYGQRVEELGFRHVLAYEHVLGADPAVHHGWQGYYQVADQFHEPMVLYGFLAGITSLEFVTAILVLPQRQTPLVAKQTAEVDLLSGGRFRLGIGVGWNAVEYQAMGQDFTNRGRRVEEQVDLLRRLWTEPSLSYAGTYHRLEGVGLNPLPVQRPIPIWFGVATSERAFRRVGRLGDGWFPQMDPGPELDRARALIEQGAAEAGRDPSRIGMEGQVDWEGDPGRLAEKAKAWRDAGATHLSVNTMGAGLRTVDDHLDALASAAEAVKPLAE
ncbi:MAG TPA: LLM class F420-dependent oxidoreductase [Streptosporangiaceae bacterium]|jgi:probable F420-dependent oxidoreductase